jgi:thiaminase/transcriptional activator TenA
MSFADTILTENLDTLRHRLLYHPLWQQIEEGQLPRERLALFALQDWWLVSQAYRLDALAIAGAHDLETQELLIKKLAPKAGSLQTLITFGQAVGLQSADFEHVEPLAGCMALTTYFYWMLAYGSQGERLAAVSASEDIFIQICLRIYPALQHHYQLTAQQVEFFSLHKEIAEHVEPIDQILLRKYADEEERRRITRAVRLSHEFEVLFYDTILNTPLKNC